MKVALSFADDDKSVGSSIANDKILDERPLELSDAKLMPREEESISDSRYEQLCLELEDLQINGNLASDSE